MKRAFTSALACAAMLSTVSTASADFIGQTLLGPIGPGSVVNGDTTGASDDNDGFTSGGSFFDVWHGGDDVWQLNWPGGDLELQMTYNPGDGDLDLFLFEPGSLDDSSNYSVFNTGVEIILAPAAPAGTYYVNVDGVGFDEGAYTLTVTPEPSALALLGLGLMVCFVRRSRKTN